MNYDELVQELRKPQLTIEILESVSPQSSSVHRMNNGKQININTDNETKQNNSSLILEAMIQISKNHYETNL